MDNAFFVTACTPSAAVGTGSGVASQPVCPRLRRLMAVFSLFPMTSDELTSVYTAVFKAWLEEFPAYSLTHHKLLAHVSLYSLFKL